MKLIAKISPADFATLLNALLGFLAITYIIDGLFLLAIFLIVIAILVDGLDGMIARWLGSKHEYGRYLDFFADTISFCLGPAILLYLPFYDPSRGSAWVSWENALTVVVPTFLVCTGILRLARFAERGYKRMQFEGLPTPALAFLVIVLYLLFGKDALVEDENLIILSLGSIAGSFLMISSVPFPKIRGGLRLPASVGILFALLSSGLAFYHYNNTLCQAFSILALVLILAYILIGPFFVMKAPEVGRPKSL